MLFTELASATNNGWGVDTYPTTPSGWVTRYEQLRRIYLMAEYAKSEQEVGKLFRALDDDGVVIDWTRRVFGVGAFLVNTDARALTGGRALLERPRGSGSTSTLRAGEAVWRRSQMGLQLPMVARMTACLGDYWIEAVRTSSKPPYATTLVLYDPALVTPVYDTIVPSRLVSVTIAGTTADGKTMERVVTAEDVKCKIDGEVLANGTGEHGAGVVPMVQLRWLPFQDFEHSLGAMHGIDTLLMRIDSAVCQLQAGLTRFGNPTIVVKGARMAAGTGGVGDAGRFGRVMHGLPPDASVDYLQLASGTIDGGLSVIRECLGHLRETRPEFLFANSGAGESGAARSYLAASFRGQIMEVRGHWFEAVARITGIAAALDESAAYDEERHALTIDAPDPLPVDVKGEIEALYLAASDMKRSDRVRKLQSIGMIDPTVDPDVYAVEVSDEQAASASVFMAPDPVVTGDVGAPQAST